MIEPIDQRPDADTILEGPFWPGPVRVLRAHDHDNAVRIEAVGVVDSLYYDRTITAEQFSAQVKEAAGGTHSQAEFPHVVALMGSLLAERQLELLVQSVGSQGKITVLFDEGDAGRNCSAQCVGGLSAHVLVKIARLPNDARQPDQLIDEEIHRLFEQLGFLTRVFVLPKVLSFSAVVAVPSSFGLPGATLTLRRVPFPESNVAVVAGSG